MSEEQLLDLSKFNLRHEKAITKLMIATLRYHGVDQQLWQTLCDHYRGTRIASMDDDIDVGMQKGFTPDQLVEFTIRDMTRSVIH